MIVWQIAGLGQPDFTLARPAQNDTKAARRSLPRATQVIDTMGYYIVGSDHIPCDSKSSYLNAETPRIEADCIASVFLVTNASNWGPSCAAALLSSLAVRTSGLLRGCRLQIG